MFIITPIKDHLTEFAKVATLTCTCRYSSANALVGKINISSYNASIIYAAIPCFYDATSLTSFNTSLAITGISTTEIEVTIFSSSAFTSSSNINAKIFIFYH